VNKFWALSRGGSLPEIPWKCLHFIIESVDNRVGFNHREQPMSKLTHLDAQGRAQMVDISGKAVSSRLAVAAGEIHMQAATLALIAQGGHKKGDVLAVARVAGIQAAKKCADLIPLCHPLLLTSVNIEFELDQTQNRVLVVASCGLDGKTGVEMEALSAASVAALTIYDMCKAVDKDMVIGNIRVLRKSGGKSGDYERLIGNA